MTRASWRVHTHTARPLRVEEGADDEPKQKTEKGLEIPVPKRDDFLSNLEKASRPGDSAIR
jgi:hypothetical protein